MTEYTTIELIKEVKTNSTGQVVDVDFSFDRMKEMAAQGWKVHTLFPDPHGTCLLERTDKIPDVELLVGAIKGMTDAITTKKWWQFFK